MEITELPEQLAARIVVNEESRCWLWIGSTTKQGYGKVTYEGKSYLVHRLVRVLLTGEPIPAKHVLDHLLSDRPEAPGPCVFGPSCCNPEHNEPVTVRVNSKRVRPWNRNKETCPAGHPYTSSYTGADGYTRRYCDTCRKARKVNRGARSQPVPAATVSTSYAADVLGWVVGDDGLEPPF